MTHLTIYREILGPVSTNCYFLVDLTTNEAVVIDPAWDGKSIYQLAGKRNWEITQLWYTHAHFDHFAGAAVLVQHLGYVPSIALHPADRDLWKAGGGSTSFGFNMDPGPEPGIDLSVQQTLSLGVNQFCVVHTPGHSPGSSMFYCANEDVAFTGDLIFFHSVGRTDLPGGDWEALRTSILKKVYTLPPNTRILPGHGDETTVQEERDRNPFIHT